MLVRRKAKKTVLFITHQIDEAIFLSDRVAVFTARPGRVKKMVGIQLERPRKLTLKRDPRFHEVEDYIWNLIHEESRGNPQPSPSDALSQR